MNVKYKITAIFLYDYKISSFWKEKKKKKKKNQKTKPQKKNKKKTTITSNIF